MRCAIVAASLLAAVVLPVAPADAAPALTIRPITWNVLGIDSNNPATSGPDTFPVAARICNTGDSTATNVTSSFVFDSANSFINVSGLSGLSLGDLAAGACVDAVYNVVVARNTAAFDTSRLYRISAAATGMSPISTPSNRELYVERLISQNRNAVLGITGSAIDVAPSTSAPGHATVVVGQTYDFTVTSQTAPGGYEQLESFLNFPNTIFQVMAVNASYPTPTGATNDTVYADACGWDNNIGPRPPRGTYLSCAGPANYPGGKAGGGPIVTTYTVKVVATGTGTLSTLIYDFSGSSFHYNTDFGANLNAVVFETVNPPDLSITKSHVGRFRAGATGSYAISVTNVGGAPTRATTTVVDSLPPELSFQSAAGTGWTCSASGQTVTCDYPTALAAGESSTIDLTVAVDPDAPTTVTNTATVATAGDSNTANNATSDPTTIDAQPAAVSDSASTPEDTATTVDVLANDSGLRDTPVTVSSTDPPNGTVSCSPTSCTYTPDADFSGTDSFSYTVSDADGDSASATVTITVTPVNDPPAYTAAPTNTSQSITQGGAPVPVAATDPDGDALTHTLTGGSLPPGVSLRPDGSFSGPASTPGTFTSTIAVADGNGGVDTTTLTVVVSAPAPNQAPLARPDTAATAEDTAVSLDPRTNDSDPDGDPLSIVSSTDPPNGTVSCSPTSCTYTPDADFSGTDSFSYTVSDGRGGTASATVTITVTPVNDPPAYTAAPTNTSQSITQGGAPVPLAATDPDGDALTHTLTGGSLPPGVTLNPDGSFSGPATTPGTFTSTITVADGNGGVDTTTLTVVVSAPASVGGTVFSDADGDGTRDPGESPIQGVTVTLLQGAAIVATATTDAGGSYGFSDLAAGTYTVDVTPPAGFATLTTGNDPTTVPLVAGQVRGDVHFGFQDRLPSAAPDTATTSAATAVSVPVMDNDDQGDGPATVTASTQAANGSVSCTPSACTYTPRAGFSGTDSFSYTITDADGDSSTAAVSVTVSQPANQPPAFSTAPANQEQTVTAGQPLAPLTGTDPEAAAVTFELVAGQLPAGVTLKPDGSFSGVPTTPGDFTPTIRLCDNRGACVERVVPIHVLAAGLAGTSPGPAAGPGAVGAGGVEAGGIGAGGVGAGASSRVSPLRGTRSGGTGSLPRTGGPLRPLTGTGLVLVLAGGLILGVARRRSCAE